MMRTHASPLNLLLYNADGVNRLLAQRGVGAGSEPSSYKRGRVPASDALRKRRRVHHDSDEGEGDADVEYDEEEPRQEEGDTEEEEEGESEGEGDSTSDYASSAAPIAGTGVRNP
jgi:hypothetical protein